MQHEDSKDRIRLASILFDGLDQIDLTGPFEVFSRLSNCSYDVVAKQNRPFRDTNGLRILPDKTFDECGDIDVLHIPGGPGQEQLMDDEDTLSFIREKAQGAKLIFAVCTGTLVCGAAGLLRGRKATTHWAFKSLLPYFGATIDHGRVCVDGNLITCAGVTSGIDGALVVASLLRGNHEAKRIQLMMEYAPEPPFNCGSPESADAEVLQSANIILQPLFAARLATAQACATRLNIVVPEQ